VPEALLAILKFCFLALLWLFFVRVLRVAWVEVTAPPTPAAAPAQAVARAPTADAGEALRLRVVEPSALRGRTYELGLEATLGRAGGCQVAIPEDTYVSQLHARVYRRDGRLWLEDLNSTNGTYVNAKKVSAPVALRRGDRVQVGRTVLEVSR
jgi:hypothetical protein